MESVSQRQSWALLYAVSSYLLWATEYMGNSFLIFDNLELALIMYVLTSAQNSKLYHCFLKTLQ